MTITDSDRFAVEDISRDICLRAVRAFTDGWKRPHPHAWDNLLATDVELHQPLMPDGVGVDHWQREFARLQAFLPDIQGEVLDWAPMSDGVVIHLRCNATAGGRPLTVEAIDRLRLSGTGTVVRRDSFFDPTRLVVALLTRPRAWHAWWLSGMAPLTARRPILRGRNGDRRRILTVAIGLTRIALGLTVFSHPEVVSRSLGLDSSPRSDAWFAARAFAARDMCIGVATLSQQPGVAKIGLRLGLFADAADTVAVLRGRLARKVALSLSAATSALAAAGVLAGTRK